MVCTGSSFALIEHPSCSFQMKVQFSFALLTLNRSLNPTRNKVSVWVGPCRKQTWRSWRPCKSNFSQRFKYSLASSLTECIKSNTENWNVDILLFGVENIASCMKKLSRCMDCWVLVLLIVQETLGSSRLTSGLEGLHVPYKNWLTSFVLYSGPRE